MIPKNFFVHLLGLFILLTACGNDPLDVDASKEAFDTEFVNLHNVIYHADSVELMKKDQDFRQSMDEIYAYFRGYCMRIGDVKDTAFYRSIQLYRADSIMQLVDQDILSKFASTKDIEDNLKSGFQHLKYHFEDAKQPKHIVFLNSNFTASIWSTNEEIGIGMERYLGPENRVVRNLDPTVIFQWIKEGMRKEFIERDAIQSWVETHIIEEEDGNLAQEIIRMGKVYYLVEAAFPKFPKHIVLRYSEEQLKWAEENEFAFWKYLGDEKLLFETNERNSTNMLQPGPTTSGLPIPGSPDRMGAYLGWKMIHSYMDQNEISLKELLEVPYNKILNDYEIDD